MESKIIKGINSLIDPTVKIIGKGTLILGNNCEIRAYSIIEFGNNGTLEIGDNSVIGYHNFFQVTGKIKIGKGTLIGPSVVTLASSHPINDKPLIGQPLINGYVTIEDNVWIGANVTIGYNVKIESNSIIGANSFVNTLITKNTIWAGSPAKFIKDR